MGSIEQSVMWAVPHLLLLAVLSFVGVATSAVVGLSTVATVFAWTLVSLGVLMTVVMSVVAVEDAYAVYWLGGGDDAGD